MFQAAARGLEERWLEARIAVPGKGKLRGAVGHESSFPEKEETLLQRLGKALGVVLAVASVGFAAWIVYAVAVAVLNLVGQLQAGEKLALLTALVTILGSTLAVMIGRSLEKRKELEALHRDKKIPIYDEFLTGILKRFQAGESESFKDEDLVDFLKTWHRRLILWGGNDVVQKYATWLLMLRTQAADPTLESLIALEGLLRAIRKELGHSDRNVRAGTYVGFLLRHPELVYEAIRTNPRMRLTELAALEKKADEAAQQPAHAAGGHQSHTEPPL